MGPLRAERPNMPKRSCARDTGIAPISPRFPSSSTLQSVGLPGRRSGLASVRRRSRSSFCAAARAASASSPQLKPPEQIGVRLEQADRNWTFVAQRSIANASASATPRNQKPAIHTDRWPRVFPAQICGLSRGSYVSRIQAAMMVPMPIGRRHRESRHRSSRGRRTGLST